VDTHQQRLWGHMIRLVDQYSSGAIEFSRMVGELEGALDAAEIRDNTLISQWYDAWTPLEIIRSAPDHVPQDAISAAVAEMRSFLVANAP
jgi:hypothetical protein